MNIHLSKLGEIVKDREVWSAIVHGVTGSDKSWQLNNKISIRKNARNQERDIKHGCLALSKQGRFHWHVCSLKPLYHAKIQAAHNVHGLCHLMLSTNCLANLV